ncbi:hypothetical protein F1737_02220 [Methanoplanus sp. FWC-SCC4]|uniref:YYY membrane protein n=1 Tax=Methanochimaera problematica TaxID=2609417 RepID=A0AA97FB01_9EURY|nr:DUF2298 domain-containing protein [Methanoplanus sp. FWC-SCC4]WOF15582.1 hypothetical protein F1737_02220 [Methanoplanus sp. FWC-SCC4]
MTPEIQILYVILWMFILKFIQISIWPALKNCFGEYSYGISYPASILLFGLISWYCGILGVTIYTALIPFAAILAYYLIKKEYCRENFQGKWKWDLVFFLLFLFMLEVRYLNPSISYAEKFMDHAFLASVINNPIIPPQDPWYSGGFLNVYYYLGHWIMGCLAVVSGVKSVVAFNFILPTVLANAGISLYATGKLLLKRFAWLPVLTMFLVNPSFIYHILSGDSMPTVMWESTRTIQDTITEFPVFSMLWGDPHAHVISLFNQAFFIFLIVFAYLRWNDLKNSGRWIITGLLSLSLGSMPLINTWDVLIYAPVLLCFAALIWWKTKKDNISGTSPWRLFVLVPAFSVAIYLPFYLMLNAGGIEGIGIVNTPTDLISFLLVYGFFLLIFYAECFKDLKERPYLIAFGIPFILAGYIGPGLLAIPVACLIFRRSLLPEEILASIGLLIIGFTEIMYLKDNMGDQYYRMNTVFKFSLIGWMMMGTSSMIFAGKWLEKRNYGSCQENRKRSVFIAVILSVLFSVPVVMPDLNYGYGGKTLDGMEWLSNMHPGDYDALSYLRTLEGDITIVEAEGGDYKYYSRVSSFTGFSTIIGMPFHEYMWRGDDALVYQRTDDVRKIYENRDESFDLMKKYNMTHIYVGDTERDTYNLNLPAEKLKLIYNKNNVQIYALN